MNNSEVKAILENLLLAADQPVTLDHLHQTLSNGMDKSSLQTVLEELKADYESKNLQIIKVAGGYQLCTRQEYSEWIRKFLKLDKTFKLSQPALDTLSIIAYKQPLTRAEVEEIRGVDSSGVFRTLLEKKVIASAGRKDVAGRPILYRTTQKFLEYFGLNELTDLPTLEDFKESELEDIASQTEINFESAETPPSDEGQSDEPDPD